MQASDQRRREQAQQSRHSHVQAGLQAPGREGPHSVLRRGANVRVVRLLLPAGRQDDVLERAENHMHPEEQLGRHDKSNGAGPINQKRHRNDA